VDFDWRYQQQKLDLMDCVNLYNPTGRVELLVISRCPLGVSTERASLCESNDTLNGQFDQHWLFRKLFYLTDNFYYKNFYCAFCNGVASWDEMSNYEEQLSVTCHPTFVERIARSQSVADY
jgi:hypothetical protein